LGGETLSFLPRFYIAFFCAHFSYCQVYFYAAISEFIQSAFHTISSQQRNEHLSTVYKDLSCAGMARIFNEGKPNPGHKKP
jgi:hypothetical protein